MVLEGRVEAAVLNESGTIQRSRMMRSKSNIFAIDPRHGQIEAGPGPEEFVSASDVVAPPLTLDPGYKSAVLGVAPLGILAVRRDHGWHGRQRDPRPSAPPRHGADPAVAVGAGEIGARSSAPRRLFST